MYGRVKGDLVKMINKIKELLRIKQDLDGFSKKIGDQRKDVNNLSNEFKKSKNEFKELKKEILNVKKSQEDTSKELSKIVQEIRKSQESLSSEITDFKLLKGQMTTKIIESMKKEVQESFLDSMDMMKTDVKRFNDLRDELLGLKSKLDSIAGEINKFKEISSRIKKEDFEFTKHAKMIISQDNEKLNLMRKIDALQRLVSRERRGKY